MERRERSVVTLSAVFFLAAALAVAAVVPNDREASPLLILGLLLGYALVARVRFEFGSTYVTAEQLVLVPIILLLPLPYVPLLVAAAALLSMVPDFVNGSWHRERALSPLSDSWFSIGPVLVLALFASGEPKLELTEVYVLAFAAQLGGDFAWATVRDRIIDGIPLNTSWENWLGVARFDAVLCPLAFMVTLAAVSEPLVLLTLGPLVWLLDILARDRKERYAAALELHRAYRGTVMLLSDVVEFEDRYTADHSRSVVDMVDAVADEMGIHPEHRRELEFAALLHDVGKIAIPKEILNKPASLDDQEWELMKTHTIEGQFMLDRVGGLLGRVGEIVRSCHERWDGRGYPDGLTGEEIPVPARIVFVCDAYNAMTTDRPYRAARSSEEALLELATHAGTQFDPSVVTAITKVVQEGQPVLAPVDEVRAVLAGTPVPQRVGAAL
jgi:HD domain